MELKRFRNRPSPRHREVRGCVFSERKEIQVYCGDKGAYGYMHVRSRHLYLSRMVTGDQKVSTVKGRGGTSVAPRD